MGHPAMQKKQSRHTLSVPAGVFSDSSSSGRGPSSKSRETLGYGSAKPGPVETPVLVGLSAPKATVDESQLEAVTESGSADLSSADTRSADTRSADTRSADTRSADIGSADIGSAETRSSDISTADRIDAPESKRERVRRALRGNASLSRYEERQVLGVGGMGEVRLAIDRDIGRNVAIKRLHPEQAPHWANFVKEARTVGLLEHPNIVPVHDIDTDDDGNVYFVMKHVEGETLENVIEKLRARDPAYLRRWSFEARIELFLGVLRALEYAHAAGVVHRDIKPANVMVGPYGEVVVMDWGIALREGERDPGAGTIVGTPYYMSPEQARGESVGPSSDLYSAAVLFHEFVVLEHYLEPLSTPAEVLSHVADHGWRWSMMDWFKPRPQPMPPMELYHFLHKGMAHEKEKRFESAGTMLFELQRILEGRMRVQCHLTLVKRATRTAGRFVDRRPWIAFGMFAATVGAAVYGVGSAVVQVL